MKQNNQIWTLTGDDLLQQDFCDSCNLCVKLKLLELGVESSDSIKIRKLKSDDLEVHITKNNIPKKKIIFPSDSSNLVCLTK